MAKKIFIVIILLLTAGGMILFGAYYFNTRNNAAGEPITVSDFIPFNFNLSQNTPNIPIETGTLNSTTTDGILEQPKNIIPLTDLRKISEKPVAGSTIVKNKNFETIRYVERATGHVYEINTEGTETSRVTKTTVPKVYEVLWGNEGESLAARYLDQNEENIVTFLANIKTPAASTETPKAVGELKGNYLPENISAISVAPSGNKLFFIINTGNGSQGFISDIDGKNLKNILNSKISEFSVSWPSEDLLVLVTKPSANVNGFSFFLNAKTGRLSQITNSLGLNMVANKDFSKAVVSNSSDSYFSTKIIDLKTGILKSVDVSTLAEKCVWRNLDSKTIYCAVPESPQLSQYPDSWYQGRVSFSDKIWSINADTGAAKEAYDLSQKGEKIDAINLQISPSGKYLIFTNKNDYSLWELKLATSTVFK